MEKEINKLKALPPWSQVACIVRCVQRVAPASAQFWGALRRTLAVAEGLQHRCDLFAELLRSAEEPEAVLSELKRLHSHARTFATEASAIRQELFPDAESGASLEEREFERADAAVLSFVLSVRAAIKIARKDDLFDSEVTQAVELSILAAPTKEEFLQSLRFDISWFAEQKNSAASLMSLPLWLGVGDTPPWYLDAIADRNGAAGEGCELVLTLDVPDDIDPDELKRQVAALAVEADSYHRGLGGHGLKISGIEVHEPSCVPEGSPS